MAGVNFHFPVAGMQGEMDGMISRTKKWRDADGRVVFEGKQEAYRVKKPRNLSIHPIEGDEKANQTSFGSVATRVVAELADPERRKYWNQRYLNQLKKADAQATVDPYSKQPKIYKSLRGFVLAMMRKEA